MPASKVTYEIKDTKILDTGAKILTLVLKRTDPPVTTVSPENETVTTTNVVEITTTLYIGPLEDQQTKIDELLAKNPI